MVVTTGTVPCAGERISLIGGLLSFQLIKPPGDGFANDAIWRASPLSFWKAALACATRAHAIDRQTDHHTSNDTCHTGVRAKHQIQRSTVAIRERYRQRCQKQFNRLVWANVARPCLARSVDLGPGGTVGKSPFTMRTKFPGAHAQSLCSSLDDEDYTGNFKRGVSVSRRHESNELWPFLFENGWVHRKFQFTYKRVWYARRAFDQGLYNFAFLPFFYELLRMIPRRMLDFRHLYAPMWVADEVYGILRKNPICKCSSIPLKVKMPDGKEARRFTFNTLRKIMHSCTDPHFLKFIEWVCLGTGFHVSPASWTPEARFGRFRWQPDRTTYGPRPTVSSFITGGMASEFDRRIAIMLENEKFNLPTSNVSDITRDQYVRCWRR